MATSIATVTNTEQQEQQLINELQTLLPGARKSSKEVGERLFKLQQLCKENGERFTHHLKTLGIVRQSAYNWIALYKQFLVEDYQFPANVVKFAGIAGINVADLSHRATLYESLIQVSETPTDAQAISIVGSASSAIAAAQAKVQTTKPQLTPFEECIAAQDAAFVSMYKILTKKTKADTPERAAAEGEYLKVARRFFNPYNIPDPEQSQQDAFLLSIGRGMESLMSRVFTTSCTEPVPIDSFIAGVDQAEADAASQS